MKYDSELKRDVENELKWEPSVNDAHIGVTVRDGIVTLTGHVPSFGEKAASEKAAKRVYGVKAVADELEVKLPGVAASRTDEDIARACAHALENNTAVPENSVKVVVRDGWITLDGEVEWQYQKEAAMRSVRYLLGVKAVVNNISVKARVSPKDVKDKIKSAFHRSAEIDVRRIDVEVHDGKVILHGNVRSWAEKKEAQRAAWSAPGVTSVEDQIAVTP